MLLLGRQCRLMTPLAKAFVPGPAHRVLKHVSKEAGSRPRGDLIQRVSSMAQLTEENRRSRIQGELDNVGLKPGERETERVPWKDGHDICPVIVLSLDAVVLNHRSHRIRAQIESQPEKDLISSDPFGEKTQRILAELLRAEEGFEALRLNLREEKQRAPGVITRAGLLVNANRRAVALRDLGEKYIRVAVLPPDVGNEQLAELELRLQMTKELREEYTFTNQLLFVEELRAVFGYSSDRIALLLRYAQSSDPRQLSEGVALVDRDTRLLAAVREIQALSEGALPYAHFDDQRQSLIELDEAYEKMKRQDPLAAGRLRMTRFIGIIAQSGYKVLRKVDSEFFRDYLRPAIEDDDELKQILTLESIFSPLEEDEAEAGDLDLLDTGVETDEADGVLEGFVGWFASMGRHLDQPKGDIRIKVPRESVRKRIRSSMEGAAELSKADTKKENRVEAPTNRVSEAIDKVRRARPLLGEAASDPRFDMSRFEFKLKKLEKAVLALRQAFDKTAADQ